MQALISDLAGVLHGIRRAQPCPRPTSLCWDYQGGTTSLAGLPPLLGLWRRPAQLASRGDHGHMDSQERVNV